MANAAAGWYDDGSGRQRRWDGEQWMDVWQEASGARRPPTSRTPIETNSCATVR